VFYGSSSRKGYGNFSASFPELNHHKYKWYFATLYITFSFPLSTKINLSYEEETLRNATTYTQTDGKIFMLRDGHEPATPLIEPS
jgi:hypothetical protein